VILDFKHPTSGRFCWLDLAASDAGEAAAFYAGLFGWTSDQQAANGGTFTRLRHAAQDVGSMYQMSRKQLEHGMPSHWTPYVKVDRLSDAAEQAERLGGSILVSPFTVSGIARIALIQDSVGAPVGLWESLPAIAP